MAQAAARRALDFGGAGLSPYDGYPGHLTHVYRHADDDALGAVRACVSSIGPQIHATVGVVVLLATWTGEDVVVSSMRSFHEPHVERSASVTQSRECR